MAGYANRTIPLRFEDLSEEGDLVYVTIRNPRTTAGVDLTTLDVPLGPDGQPLDPQKAADATYRVIAGLIVDWHVYDATSTAADQPLLDLPATPDNVRLLPLEIITRIGEEMQAAASPR